MESQMSLSRITKLSNVNPESGCWIWAGTLDKGISPVLRVSRPHRKLVSARRFAYETHNVVIVPKNYVVTSICKNSLCVNPRHLTAQKRGVHSHRQVGSWKPKFCKRGHEQTEWTQGKQKNGTANICLVCDKERRRINCQKHREMDDGHAVQLRTIRISARRDLVNSIKSAKGCELCHITEPACLDFHHIDPTTKVETIAEMVNSQRAESVIIAEINKCRILCANCHRIVHAQERAERLENI